jgi:tetratricopeptide (TPR) repeat protein
VGQASMNRHDMEDAIRYARRGVEIARANGEAPQYLANELSLLANALRQSGDLNGALAAINQSRAIGEGAAFANETSRSLSLYSILWRQGQILGSDEGISLGRKDAALEPLQKAFDLMEQQAAKDPNDATSRDREATAAWQLGDVLWRSDAEKALAVFDRAILRERELTGNVKARREEARLLGRSSYPLRKLGRQQEAKQRIDSAFDLLRATKDYPADQIDLGSVAEMALRALGDQQAESGRVGEAVATYGGLLSKVMASQPKPRSDLRQANDLSRIYLVLERLQRQQGHADEASKVANLRLELWRAWDGKLPGNSFVRRQLTDKLDDPQ